MKITIELNDDEEDFEIKAFNVLNGNLMREAIGSYDYEVFHTFKHKELSETERELIEEVRGRLADHFEQFPAD